MPWETLILQIAPIIVAVCAGVASIISALASHRTHKIVNSRMDSIIEELQSKDAELIKAAYEKGKLDQQILDHPGAAK